MIKKYDCTNSNLASKATELAFGKVLYKCVYLFFIYILWKWLIRKEYDFQFVNSEFVNITLLIVAVLTPVTNLAIRFRLSRNELYKKRVQEYVERYHVPDDFLMLSTNKKP